MRRTRFGLGSKNSARLKSFYILLFFFLFFFFPLPIYPNIPSSSLWKSGKNTVEKWNKNGERENSLATCQAKKEKEKKRERTRLCSYYFLMAHSSLLLPRSSLQSKLLDISSPPFVVHFVAPFYLLPWSGDDDYHAVTRGGGKFRSIRGAFAYDSRRDRMCAVWPGNRVYRGFDVISIPNTFHWIRLQCGRGKKKKKKKDELGGYTYTYRSNKSHVLHFSSALSFPSPFE